MIRRRWPASLVLLGAAAILAGAAAARPAASPLPIWQRLLLGGEYPGFIPQAAPPTVLGFGAGVKATHSFYDSLQTSAIAVELRRDHFRRGVTEDLTARGKHSAISAVLQFGSATDAARAERYFENASLLPCLNSCTVAAHTLRVPAINGALGAERIRHVADGTKPGDGPFQLDMVYFASGPFLYGVLTFGPPNGVDKSALFAAAKRLYSRVRDAPAVNKS
jgi:hypothetical protein